MSNPQHNPEPQGQGGPAYTQTPASSAPQQPTQPAAKPEASFFRWIRESRVERTNDRVIAGVCGAIARELGWNVTLVRVLMIRESRVERTNDRVIAGVCGAIARELGWNVTLVRVLMVVESRVERTNDRVIAGVCGAIARELGWNVTLVRVLMVVSVFFGGFGGLLYGIAWLLLGIAWLLLPD